MHQYYFRRLYVGEHSTYWNVNQKTNHIWWFKSNSIYINSEDEICQNYYYSKLKQHVISEIPNADLLQYTNSINYFASKPWSEMKLLKYGKILICIDFGCILSLWSILLSNATQNLLDIKYSILFLKRFLIRNNCMNLCMREENALPSIRT